MDNKFGTRKVSYPKNAFIVYVGIREKSSHFFYPFEYIETSFEQLHEETASFARAFALQGYEIGPECIVLPISYQEGVPLKPEYWQESDHYRFYASNERHRLFMKLLDAPDFYRVLVTPKGLYEGRELLSASIPILSCSLSGAIAHFMFGSDYPVDQEADGAALYIPAKPYAINWKNKTVARYPIIRSGQGSAH